MTPRPASHTAPETAQPPMEPSLLAGDELAAASVGLLGELEASLKSSQKAVLSRDVAGLEQATQEQMRLRRALEILWAREPACSPGHKPAESNCAVRFVLPLCTPQLAAELRAAQIRVRDLARVQAALLWRAERSLRVLSHLLAGAEANYCPASGNDGAAPGKGGYFACPA